MLPTAQASERAALKRAIFLDPAVSLGKDLAMEIHPLDELYGSDGMGAGLSLGVAIAQLATFESHRDQLWNWILSIRKQNYVSSSFRRKIIPRVTFVPSRRKLSTWFCHLTFRSRCSLTSSKARFTFLNSTMTKFNYNHAWHSAIRTFVA